MKLRVLRQRNDSGRVATFATATPVANSLREMYVMQSYLRPELLEQAGVEHFDMWASNFTRPVTSLELSPAGDSWRMKTRLAKFVNVPDLVRMYRQVSDVARTEDLDLQVPQVAGGKRSEEHTSELQSRGPL